MKLSRRDFLKHIAATAIAWVLRCRRESEEMEPLLDEPKVNWLLRDDFDCERVDHTPIYATENGYLSYVSYLNPAVQLDYLTDWSIVDEGDILFGDYVWVARYMDEQIKLYELWRDNKLYYIVVEPAESASAGWNQISLINGWLYLNGKCLCGSSRYSGAKVKLIYR